MDVRTSRRSGDGHVPVRRSSTTAPTCTTTTVVASGTVVPGAFLGAGACIQAGDKIFGNFAGTGGTGFAAASFTFSAPNGNVTLGITDAIGPSSTATLDYQVAVTPAAIALGLADRRSDEGLHSQPDH